MEILRLYYAPNAIRAVVIPHDVERDVVLSIRLGRETHVTAGRSSGSDGTLEIVDSISALPEVTGVYLVGRWSSVEVARLRLGDIYAVLDDETLGVLLLMEEEKLNDSDDMWQGLRESDWHAIQTSKLRDHKNTDRYRLPRAPRGYTDDLDFLETVAKVYRAAAEVSSAPAQLVSSANDHLSINSLRRHLTAARGAGFLPEGRYRAGRYRDDHDASHFMPRQKQVASDAE